MLLAFYVLRSVAGVCPPLFRPGSSSNANQSKNIKKIRKSICMSCLASEFFDELLASDSLSRDRSTGTLLGSGVA